MIEQITAWKTSDDTVFTDIKKAQEHEGRLAQISIFQGLGIYWRDTNAREVAEALLDAGFIVMKREVAEEMARRLDHVQVQVLVARLKDRLKEEGAL